MDTPAAYAELGLSPTASDAEIKAAWRRLVAAWHPDRNSAADAVQRMQSINKAYQHIRQVRDGEDAAEPEESPAPQANSGQAGAGAAGDAAEGAADPSGTPATHVRKVRLTLEEAILGCTRTVRGHFQSTCSACVGKGQRVLAKACTACHGSGAVRKPALFGWLWNEEECADCGGDGRLRAPCEACEGSGERSVAYKRQVRFPAGVREGHALSVPPSQHEGVDIVLELQVEIEPHPFFTLDPEGVLRCDMPVNGYAWMAGRWVDVPTPDGLQHMRLNRDALVYRLRGQGFPATPKGPRGDYLVRVQPVFPETEDAACEALLNQLIDHLDTTAGASPKQPLGQWQRQMKRWKPKEK